ncbi:hypothetical protein P7K49_016810, partial [Saguinus oedipus]
AELERIQNPDKPSPAGRPTALQGQQVAQGWQQEALATGKPHPTLIVRWQGLRSGPHLLITAMLRG